MLEQDLRLYQSEALGNIRKVSKIQKSKGRIIIPTGGGKTAVEAFALKEQIGNSNYKIHLVLAPRIALVNQLIHDYRDNAGNDYIALAFHSGKEEPNYQKVKWDEYATTSLEKLQEEKERSQRLNKNLVIFSTYHSAHKLTDIDFDTLIADESQYCVADGFHEDIKNIKANLKLFFTATEKYTVENGRGLNNIAVYGDILFKISPQVLIDQGYIVPPRLHVIYGKASDKFSTVVDECINIAKYQHQETIKTMDYSKILFAMNGTEDVTEIVQHYHKVKKEFPLHDIFTIISNAKFGSMVNGVKVNRRDFMKNLKECNNALIFHYDILSEGIDVDGITGVAILRNMMHSKLLQTIGRAVRIYKAHPEKKKQALVTVPVINNDIENREQVSRIIKAMRDGGFDVTIEEIIFSGQIGSGVYEDDILPDGFSIDKRKSAQQILQDILHEIEEDDRFMELQIMTSQELLENF